MKHQHKLMINGQIVKRCVSCPTRLRITKWTLLYSDCLWFSNIVACGVVAQWLNALNLKDESRRLHKLLSITAEPRANQTNDQLQVTWVSINLFSLDIFCLLSFYKTPETCESSTYLFIYKNSLKDLSKICLKTLTSS